MTIGELLAVLALVIVALALWVGRQARIVGEKVRVSRLAMEAEDRAQENRTRESRALRQRGRAA